MSLPPRRFVHLSRTVHEHGHTLDAIDEDGRAWWLITGMDDKEWTELQPLPSREDRP